MSLHLILGPMFSGKTSELLRLLRRNYISHKRVLLVKFDQDTRYGDDSIVRTHDGTALDSSWCYHIKSGDHLMSCKELMHIIEDYDVIGIDEGQFFEDLADFANAVANRGRTVVIAALNGNFKQHSFATVAATIPLADSFAFLTAVCTVCKSENAVYSIQSSSMAAKKATAEPIKDAKLGDSSSDEYAPRIGGSGEWSVVCRCCLVRMQPLHDL